MTNPSLLLIIFLSSFIPFINDVLLQVLYYVYLAEIRLKSLSLQPGHGIITLLTEIMQ